jgi:plastocyanin
VKAILYAKSVTITAAMMSIILLMASVSATAPTLFKQTAIATVDQGDATANNTTTTTTGATATDNATRRVAVGGGNITFSVNQFSPQITEIQPGESVTFFAPNGSLELHNVIFDLSNGTIISDIGVPFTLPSDNLGGEVPTDVSQELLPAPPYNLGEPIIQNMADGTQAIVGFNKIAFYPAVVDQDGNVMYPEEEEIIQQMRQINQGFEGGPMPSPISTSYTMDGTERVVSSGIILDVNGFSALEALFAEEGGEEGASQQEVPATEDNQGSMTNSTMTTTTPQIPTDEETIAQQEEEEPAQEPQFPFLGSFTVTFEAPGTYDYFCAFHPGMFGQVVVG